MCEPRWKSKSVIKIEDEGKIKKKKKTRLYDDNLLFVFNFYLKFCILKDMREKKLSFYCFVLFLKIYPDICIKYNNKKKERKKKLRYIHDCKNSRILPILEVYCSNNSLRVAV